MAFPGCRQTAGGKVPRLADYPFKLGVASGDPAEDGVVIWTRLAPQPLFAGGGMPEVPLEVSWQVAEDEAMGRVVRRGVAVAEPAWAHSVHVEVDGLRPDRWYWYQFKLGGEISPKGCTRTLPAAGAVVDRLRFSFVSCQKYEVGYYTAYEHMAREDLDLVFHLGDYIYEKGDGRGAVRPHGQAEVFTLDEYRARYAVYKADLALQRAHAMAPWIVTWDDHEVSNDYADDIHEDAVRYPAAEFLHRRAAAYQAYYEHMPLRAASRPAGPHLQLYRRFAYGNLASFHVLDTRQYRTMLPPGGRLQSPGPRLLESEGTIMGEAQREWLFAGLSRSETAWNVIAQQVLIARVDRAPGPEVLVDVDKWAGYEFERRRLLRQLEACKISNPVVLTGDIHSNWANELVNDFDSRAPRAVAVELVGTSISSSGDGVERPDYLDALLAENPFVKFHNRERGYVRCEVVPHEWRTDFRTIPYVSRPGAPVHTRATFTVEAGRPKLLRQA
ncbi:MAG: alkaline phosphatase D family protein [Opitutaceae bacterium]|nr:alkaline phosphatase D family protein [Opitutaceae bacterium]